MVWNITNQKKIITIFIIFLILLVNGFHKTSTNPLIKNEYSYHLNLRNKISEFLYILDENFTDTDEDGMPDEWEEANNLDPSTDDSYLDPDMDELTNINEYLNNTDPWNPDTDEDGFNDYLEIMKGKDPVDPTDHPVRVWLFLLIGVLVIGLITFIIWISIAVKKDMIKEN